MAAYPIVAIKEITQTRNLMKFLPVGKSSTETSQTPKLNSHEPDMYKDKKPLDFLQPSTTTLLYRSC